MVDSFQWVQRLVDCDVDTLQIRIKDKCGAELKEELASCIRLCRQHNIPLYINDYWQLAIELGAYGVHLGQEDIQKADLAAIAKAGLRLGISTHGEVEFCAAKAIQPSYIAIGAIFPTNTKEVKVVGLNNLKRWAQLLTPDYPVCAIGGIGQKNLATVVDQGVDSVAVVSAICAAEDYRQAASELKSALSLQVNQQFKSVSSL